VAAKAEPERRFHQLYDKVYRGDILAHAYCLSREAHGAAGVDGQTFEGIEAQGLEEWLTGLREALRTHTYRPEPVRRVLIPKPNGGERPLGIPTIRDRVVQTAAKLVLEPIFEADFADCAYGYRPKRSALDAVRSVHQSLQDGYTDVVDADVSKYLDASSYCTPVCCGAGKESRHRLWKLDSQAFSASLLDVNGVKLAALYTLQDGLAADAQSERGFEHRDVA